MAAHQYHIMIMKGKKKKNHPQITECTKSFSVLTGGDPSVNPTASYLLNISFSDSANGLYWPKM